MLKQKVNIIHCSHIFHNYSNIREVEEHRSRLHFALQGFVDDGKLKGKRNFYGKQQESYLKKSNIEDLHGMFACRALPANYSKHITPSSNSYFNLYFYKGFIFFGEIMTNNTSLPPGVMCFAKM